MSKEKDSDSIMDLSTEERNAASRAERDKRVSSYEQNPPWSFAYNPEDALRNAKEAGVKKNTLAYSSMLEILIKEAKDDIVWDEGELVNMRDLKSAATKYKDRWPDMLADIQYVSKGGMPRWEQGSTTGATTVITAEAMGDGSPTSLNPLNVKTTAGETLTAKMGALYPLALAAPAILCALYLFFEWKSWKKVVGSAILLMVAVSAIGAYAVYRIMITAYGVAE